MTAVGVSRYRDRIRRAQENRAMASTPPGQQLLREAVSKLSAAIEAFIAKAEGHRNASSATAPGALPQLKELPADVTALITAKAVIDQISRGQLLTSAAAQLGAYLEDETRLRSFKKIDPLRFEIIMERATAAQDNRRKRKERAVASMEGKKYKWSPWTPKERARLGLTCLELLAQETGLINLVSLRDERGRTKLHIKPSEETLKWLENAHEANEVMFPFYLPCAAVPMDWTGPHRGGYHTSEVLQKPLIKNRDRNYQRSLPDIEMPEVYGAINTLQKTPWVINADVLETIATIWSDGEEIAGLPSRDERRVPDKPEDIGTNKDARREWRKAARAVTEWNNKMRSKRVQLSKILYMARRFEAIGRFWFPYSLDFRGRVYPIPYFLQPQGPDEARALLSFADAVPLGDEGAFWLNVHGANCFGEDKVSFSDRADWVWGHRKQIVDCAEDPLTYRWWAEADKPWMFLAFCFEFAKLQWHIEKNGPASIGDFKSTLPVAMDGSNNGLQIFSLLLRDEVTGRSTNCLPADAPQDIYQDVADALTRLVVQQQTDGNEQERGWASKWLKLVEGKFPRKAVKRVVMTVPYGGTMHSAQRYLIEWYDEIIAGVENPDWPYDKFNPTMFLARLLRKAIDERVHAANACMNWLKEVSNICSDNGVPMCWTSPSGFPVHHAYKETQAQIVKTTIGDRIRKIRLQLDTADLSKRKQRSGVSPNFVHSLDAACLHKTVLRLEEMGVRDYSMIHDSYAVHAAYVPKLNTAIRETFVEVFTPDLLEEYRQEVQALLPAGVELPKPPEQGSLDLQGLLEATYFFS